MIEVVSGARVGLLFCLLFCAACSNTTTIEDQWPGDAYTLDFTSSPYGGIYLASGDLSVAFTVDLKARSRAFIITAIENNKGPGMLQTNDYAGGCEHASDEALADQLGALPPGDSAKIGYIDIEMLPATHEQPLPLSGGLFRVSHTQGGLDFRARFGPAQVR